MSEHISERALIAVHSNSLFVASFTRPDRITFGNRRFRDVFSLDLLNLIASAPSFLVFKNDAESIKAEPDLINGRLGVTVGVREAALFEVLIRCLREIATGKNFPVADRLAAWAEIDRLRKLPIV